MGSVSGMFRSDQSIIWPGLLLTCCLGIGSHSLQTIRRFQPLPEYMRLGASSECRMPSYSQLPVSRGILLALTRSMTDQCINVQCRDIYRQTFCQENKEEPD